MFYNVYVVWTVFIFCVFSKVGNKLTYTNLVYLFLLLMFVVVMIVEC